MARYGYFPEDEPRVTVSTTFNSKQFGELELLGTLMQYKETQKDFWDRIGVGGSVTTAAVLWNDMLFFGACDKNFYCLGLEGKEIWRFRTNGVILGKAVIHDGKVFFESSDYNVYALDAMTGKLVWRFSTSGPALGHILVHNGIVYANSFDKNVYALDENTGKEMWRIQTVGGQTGTMEKDGILYFGYVGGVFYVFDIQAKKVLWTFKTQKDACGWEPCFWGDNVYFGSFEGNFYALNRKTGELAWKFSAADAAFPATVSGDRVYFGSNDFNAYCLDAETGRLIWKLKTAGIVNYLLESGGRVYVGSYDNNIYSVDSVSGREVWSFKTNGFVTFVRVSEGRVHAGSWDCRMYCLDANTGALIWKFKTSMSTPAILEPPEQTASGTAEVVWHVAEEETKEKKGGEIQFSDYAETKSEYAGAGMGDYLGKKKRGYV
jgi:outer membrane protein assembly factor BamB